MDQIGMILFALGGLLWGSFLNMCGYRLLSGDSLLGARSRCPQCKNVIAAYDLVPVVSYILLRGRCRTCLRSISCLYPFIELLCALAGVALWYDMCTMSALTMAELIGRAMAYGVLLSGFIIATRTDLEALVVPRFIIWMMGLAGGIGSLVGVLPVTGAASVVGALVGYGSLWLLNAASRRVMGRDGIGEGDMELLAVIGIFWGPIGVWAIAFMSSLLGVASALVYLVMTGRDRYTRIPFIPFMAASVIGYLFLQQEILFWLWAV
ncbi:MAG: leader peptidase (prepilin peptidase) / N-methyltransferase [Candidatus Dependentiae bacterium]|nr:leader peptidase (prepilin peptidase) / N-methyltransferase [Candidatus Dependentiae bacterium]